MHIVTSVKRSALILLTRRRVSLSRRVVRCKVHTKKPYEQKKHSGGFVFRLSELLSQLQVETAARWLAPLVVGLPLGCLSQCEDIHTGLIGGAVGNHLHPKTPETRDLRPGVQGKRRRKEKFMNKSSPENWSRQRMEADTIPARDRPENYQVQILHREQPGN